MYAAQVSKARQMYTSQFQKQAYTAQVSEGKTCTQLKFLKGKGVYSSNSKGIRYTAQVWKEKSCT